MTVGLGALIMPISTSLYFARQQSLSAERVEALTYTRDVMRRALETREEFRRAIVGLRNSGFAPCSPRDIDLMRRLDLSSSYIQAVGRTEGNHLTCTSLGTTAPIEIGPLSLLTEGGVEERFGVSLSLASSYPLTVLSKDGVAILIDPSLLVDTPTEGLDIAIEVFAPSKPDHGIIASHGEPPTPASLRPIAKGEQVTTTERDFIISRMRASDSDLEVVVAVPRRYANRHVREFATLFVPLGLLCGGGLVWALIFISRQRLSMQTLLRSAARRKEFFVEYQPVVELATKRWVGAEALVRWKHDGQIVRPDLFIPSAEEGGVITLITECVAAIVAADLPKLIQIDSTFKIAINLSVADLQSSRTLALLKKTVLNAGADFRNLEVEATERGFLESLETRKLIDQVRTLGIRVSIDDFGTGYSSLACLETLKLDMLKIDKAFVDTIDTDGVTSHVVPHIIEMAHSLGLEIVAEGVETEVQAQYLEARGVSYAQGWYFAKEMDIDALCESLPNHSCYRH